MSGSEKGHGNLTLWICGAIALAIALALLAPEFAMNFHVGGEIFLRLLQMSGQKGMSVEMIMCHGGQGKDNVGSNF